MNEPVKPEDVPGIAAAIEWVDLNYGEYLNRKQVRNLTIGLLATAYPIIKMDTLTQLSDQIHAKASNMAEPAASALHLFADSIAESISEAKAELAAQSGDNNDL